MDCGNGHVRAPGKISVSWLPRSVCSGGQANHNGHLRVSCRTHGCSPVWHKPRHEAEPSQRLAQREAPWAARFSIRGLRIPRHRYGRGIRAVCLVSCHPHLAPS
jgi:hypothetical protein